MLRLAHLRTANILTKSVALAVQRTAVVNSKTFLPATQIQQPRFFSLTTPALCDARSEEEGEEGEKVHKKDRLWNKYKGTARDRSRVVSVEESIDYIFSGAYKATYGNKKPWELYRRVHKGQLGKILTRATCIRHNVVATGSPCPICRDEYFVLHHTNLELLRLFINPYTGEVGKCDFFYTRNRFF